MKQELKTFEVARIYENQGYFEEAMKIYSFLDNRETSDEVRAGLKRMRERMEDKDSGSLSENRISRLYQEWLGLMILERRLDNFKKIKSHP